MGEHCSEGHGARESPQCGLPEAIPVHLRGKQSRYIRRHAHSYAISLFLLQEYELRRYSPAKWVSYTVKCMKKKEAQSDGFWKLFNYIQGENETGDPISC